MVADNPNLPPPPRRPTTNPEIKAKLEMVLTLMRSNPDTQAEKLRLLSYVHELGELLSKETVQIGTDFFTTMKPDELHIAVLAFAAFVKMQLANELS